MRASIVIALACAFALAVWLLYGSPESEEEISFLRWENVETVAAGATLYRAQCASCHGVPGLSAPVALKPGEDAAPPHDESGHTWQHPDFALFRLIRDGVAVANCAPVDPERMPRFKDVLSDGELVAVLSYIKSTWPAATRADHDRVNLLYAPYNRAIGKLIGAGD